MRGGGVRDEQNLAKKTNLKEIDKEQKQFEHYEMKFGEQNDKSCCNLL